MKEIIDAKDVNTWESGASFSLGNRIYRTLWSVCWALLASWTPPPLHGWRRALLRLFGARIDETAGIYPSARIWSPRNLEMGRFSFLGPEVNVYNIAPVVMEAYSLASQRAYLCTGTHDVDEVSFQLKARPIRIGYRAWVAADAFVGPGVIVGEGAVLGARGCAFKNLTPWTIYVGNPAVAVRERRVKAEDFKADRLP